MIKENHSKKLHVQIFYQNHQLFSDSFNENSTLFLLLEVIDKFVLNNYPKTNLKRIIHKWSDLYQAYSKNKSITIYEFLKKSEKKNQKKKGVFKYKIGYGGYMYFRYITEEISEFAIKDLNFSFYENEDDKFLVKNSTLNLNTLSEKLLDNIFQFLSAFDIARLYFVSRVFFRIIRRNLLRNKFMSQISFVNEKKLELCHKEILSENNHDVYLVDLFHFDKGLYYFLKADRYGLVYLTKRNNNEDEEILRTFSSEISCVRISDSLFLFNHFTDIEDDSINYHDDLNDFNFYCVKYDSNVALVYFYDHDENFFYAINSLGDVFSYDKVNHGFKRILRINKKEPSVNITGSESSKVVVKAYGYRDNLIVCLNRFVVFDLNLRKIIYSNKDIKVIKAICDVLIEKDILLLELKRDIVIFNTNNFQIIYKHRLYENSLAISENFFINNLNTFNKEKIDKKFNQVLNICFNFKFDNMKGKELSCWEEKTGKFYCDEMVKKKNLIKYFFNHKNEAIVKYDSRNLLIKCYANEGSDSLGYNRYLMLEFFNISISRNSLLHNKDISFNLNNYELYPKFSENIIIDKRIRKTIAQGVEDEIIYYDFYEISNSTKFPKLFKRIILKHKEDSIQIYFNHKGKFIIRTKDEQSKRYKYTLYNLNFKEESLVYIEQKYSNFVFNEFFFVLYNSHENYEMSIFIWDIRDKCYTSIIQKFCYDNSLEFCRIVIYLIGNRLFDVLDREEILEIFEYEITDDNTVVHKDVHFYLNRLRIDRLYMNDNCDVIVNQGSKFYLLKKDLSNCFFSEYHLIESRETISDDFYLIKDGVFVNSKGMAMIFENF